MVRNDMVDWYKEHVLRGSISGLFFRSSYDFDHFRILRGMNVMYFNDFKWIASRHKNDILSSKYA